jgi:hypothetical protein
VSAQDDGLSFRDINVPGSHRRSDHVRRLPAREPLMVSSSRVGHCVEGR